MSSPQYTYAPLCSPLSSANVLHKIVFCPLHLHNDTHVDFSFKTYPNHSAVIFPRQPPHKFKSMSPSSCKAFCHPRLISVCSFWSYLLIHFAHRKIFIALDLNKKAFSLIRTLFCYIFSFLSYTEDTVLLDMHVLYRALSIVLMSWVCMEWKLQWFGAWRKRAKHALFTAPT